MSQASAIAGGATILCGVLTIALCIPLVMGRVRRNHFYGIRLRTSLASDEAWYRINRYGGRRLIQWAILVVLLGCITLTLKIEDHLVVFAAVVPIILLIPVIDICRYAARHDSTSVDFRPN